MFAQTYIFLIGREKSHSRSRSRSPARYDDERIEDEDMEKEPEKAPETVSIHVEVGNCFLNLRQF